MFEKYVDALNKGEADYLSLLFSEDCVFHDIAAREISGQAVLCKGRNQVKEFFKNLFYKYNVSSELVVAYKSRAYYNVYVDDMVLKCIGNIKTKNGLITELVIDLR